MDFTLDKKHEMARSLFREFAENEVKPLAQEVDETEEFPVENVKKMQKLGFMGIPVPKEYGGQEMCIRDSTDTDRDRRLCKHKLSGRPTGFLSPSRTDTL